jgi:AcrR family transcriptional regulator
MPRAVLSTEDVESFREELCAAATRRFAQAGYAGVTLRGLADELGVSPMTPYRYFRDKDEILAAVRAAGFRRFADAQERAFAASDEPRARLHGLGLAYAEFARREPASYRIMFEMNRPGDAGNAELARESGRAWAPLHRAVAAATEAGLLRGDAETVAHLFWAALHGLVSLELAGSLRPGQSLGRLLEPMLDTLFRGRASQKEAS